ncbi:MAG: discoidin domain-containing protein, partial [Pseudomonadota bacterium]
MDKPANVAPERLAATLVASAGNLAQGRPASASSTWSSSFPAAAAVDANGATRWSSQASDAQWLTVDLGGVMGLNHVVLKWESAYARAYQIALSNDGVSWRIAYSTSGGAGGTEDIHFSASSARYVRMVGVQRATSYGYSLFEMAVYNDAPAANFALNKPATASSMESATLAPAAAVDGNAGSRWSSLASDAQWIRVDLGAVSTINHVVLSWEAAYAKAYQIQTSQDGNSWQTVYSTGSGAGGNEDIRFNAVSARYVRMNASQRGTPWGYSLYEFAVLNDVAPTPTPTPTPPP